MDSFTSTGLYSLLVSELAKFDPTLPGLSGSPDPMQVAVLSDAPKRALIDAVMERHGPGPLLQVGLALPFAEETPVLATLKRSADTNVVAEKWMRLERYFHSSHRTIITTDTPNEWHCARLGDEAPATLGENCLIAGVLFGLLEAAGVCPNWLEIGGNKMGRTSFGSANFAADETANRFCISWTANSNRSANHETARDATSDRLASVLSSDPGRLWRIDDVARTIGTSRRSLQRHLAAESRSFSSVLRRARLAEAARLLEQTDTSLAGVGYCCGYADQAHFQRDFRRVMNMTPGHFRKVAGAGQFGTIIQ